MDEQMGAVPIIEAVAGRLADLAETVDIDCVDLTAEQRARGHLRARSQSGRELIISLPRGAALEEGAVLAVDNGVALVVRAADEDVLDVRPLVGEASWARAAWHLGNLHRPVYLVEDGMLTPYDDATKTLLSSVGVPCRRTRRGFVGERLGSIGGHVHG